MAFENVFSNVDFRIPVQAAQNQQNNFMNALSQGLAIANAKQDRELRQRQVDMQQQELEYKLSQPKPMDYQQVALDELYRMNTGQGQTPQGQAAIQLMGQTAQDKSYFDPVTGQQVVQQSPWRSLGMGATGAQQMPSMPMGAMSPSPQQPPMLPQMGMQEVGGMGGAQQIKPIDAAPFEQMQREAELLFPNDLKGQQAFKQKAAEDHRTQKMDMFKAEKKQKELLPAKEQFERQLSIVLNDLDELKNQGGVISADRSALGNAGAMAAELPLVGKAAQSIFDPKTQTLRDTIDGKRPVLFNQIKKASGLTGSELNSQFEVENQLKQLGNPSMTYEARKALITDLSNIFGTGKLANSEMQKQQQPVRPDMNAKARVEQKMGLTKAPSRAAIEAELKRRGKL